MVSHITRIEAPTEVDHYQIRRTLDIYVRPQGEDLGRIADSITKMIAATKMPQGIEAFLRGSVEAMRASLRSFAFGLSLSVVLLYLVLVAQFRSFKDPFLILLAFPPGITGALLALWMSHTPLNVMSLMGLVMLAGVTMSNSILIVEFAHHLVKEGHAVSEAVVTSCAVRLRPILMTTFRNHDWIAAYGAQNGRGERIVRSPRVGAGRWVRCLGAGDGVYCACGIPAGLPQGLIHTFAVNNLACVAFFGGRVFSQVLR